MSSDTMGVLNRNELLAFIGERRDLFDAQGNPFCCTDWLTHLIQHVAKPDWRFHVPQYFVGGESLMSLAGGVSTTSQPDGSTAGGEAGVSARGCGSSSPPQAARQRALSPAAKILNTAQA